MSCRYVYNGNEYSRGEMLKLIKDGKIASAKVVDQSFAKEEIRRITGMTDSQIGFVKGLIEGRAIGQLNADGTILLSDMATTSTVYHEAFHRVWQGALTAQEREAAVRELKTNKNWKQLIEPYRAEYGNNEDVLIEEYFADEFANFVLGEPKPRTFLQKLFDQLVKMLKYITGAKPSEIKKIYQLMKDGGYASRPYISKFTKSKQIKHYFKNKKESFYMINVQDYTAVVEGLQREVFTGIIDSKKLDELLLSKTEVKVNVNMKEVVDNYLQKLPGQMGIVQDDIVNMAKNWNSFSTDYKKKLVLYAAIREDLLSGENSQILEKYREYQKYLKSKMSYTVSKEGEEIVKQDEDLEEPEDGGGVGSRYDKNAFEFDPVSSMSAQLRFILASLEDSSERSPNGIVRSYNWVEMSNFLLTRLAGTEATEEAVFGKLGRLVNHRVYGPGAGDLIRILGGPTSVNSSMSTEQKMLRMKFVTFFSNNQYQYNISSFSPDVFKLYDSVQYALRIKIREMLGSYLIESVRKNVSPEKLYEALRNIQDDLKNKKIKVKEEIEKTIELFGISKEYDLLDDAEKEKLIEVLRAIRTKVLDKIKKDKQGELINLIPDMFTQAGSIKFDINGYVNNLTDIIDSIGKVVENSTITPDGDKVYTISQNNFMTQTINKINDVVSRITPEMSMSKRFEMLFKEMPQLKNWGGKNSLWLTKILKDRLNLQVVVNIGAHSEDLGLKKSFSEIEESDLYAFYMGQMLLPTSEGVRQWQTVKHSDRSVIYGMQIVGDGKTELDVEAYTKKDIRNKIRNVYRNYLLVEMEKLANLPKDIQNLSTLKYEDTLFGNFVDYNRLIKDGKPIWDWGIAMVGGVLPSEEISTEEKIFKEELDKLVKGIESSMVAEYKLLKTAGIFEKVDMVVEKQDEQSGEFYNEVVGFKPAKIPTSVWNYYKNKIEEDAGSIPFDEMTEIVSNLFSINSQIGLIEQSFIVTGDPNLYKSGADAIKRFSLLSSTGKMSVHGQLATEVIKDMESREGSLIKTIDENGEVVMKSYFEMQYANNPNFISTITLAEEEYYVSPEVLDDYEIRAKEGYKQLLLNTGKTEKEAEEQSTEQARRLREAYEKTNWADGQSYLNIFEWRRSKIKWGQWGEPEQRLFEQEVKILNGEADAYSIPEGMTAQEYFNTFLGLATTEKAQYAGPAWRQPNTQTKEPDGYYNVAKTGYFPLLPSQIRGTKMEQISRKHIEKGIGAIHFGSARKIGQRITVDENGKPLTNNEYFKGVPRAYVIKREGDKATAEINLDIDYDNNIQFFQSEFFRQQLPIPQHEKGEIVASTQSYKLTTSNLVNNGIPIDVSPDVAKNWNTMLKSERIKASPIYSWLTQYTNIMSKRIDVAIDELQRRMNFEGGEYQDGYKELVGVLKEAVEARGALKSSIDILDTFEQASIKAIEMLPNRQKLEPVLYALVNNMVRIQKRAGNSVPQISSAFFEPAIGGSQTKLGTVKDKDGKEVEGLFASEEYQMYSKGGKNYADLGMPMPTKWMDAFMEIYGTRNVLELIDMVNDDIANERFDKFDPEILLLKGLRIPNQQLSSNDIFRIKKFFPPTNQAMVVVPAIIATKVGSDFDIDKLNTYLAHALIVKKDGVSKFRYLTKDVVEDKLTEMVDEFLSRVSAEKSIYEGKTTRERADSLLIMFNRYISDLRNKKDRTEEESRDLNLFNSIKYYRNADDRSDLFMRIDENKLLELEINIMTHPLNFLNLMKPTDDRQWKVDAFNMMKERSKRRVDSNSKLSFMNVYYKSLDPQVDPSMFDVYTSTMNVIKTRENIASKAGVGTGAVSATNHAVNQNSGLFIKLKVTDSWGVVVQNRELPFLPPGYDSFSAINSIDGEIISELISGLITSQVDAVKMPYAKKLMLFEENLGIATYLVQRGAGYLDIVKFLTQPVIKSYTLYKTEERSLTNPDADNYEATMAKKEKLLKDNGLLGNEDFENLEFASLKALLPFIEAGVKFKDLSVEMNNLSQEDFLKSLEDIVPEDQFYMLKWYKEISHQASQHRQLMNTLSMDTFTPTTAEEIINRRSMMKQQTMLNSRLIENISGNLALPLDDNIISPFFKVMNANIEMFVNKLYMTKKLFDYTDEDGNMISFEDQVMFYVSEQLSSKTKGSMEPVMNRMTQDFATFLVQSYSKSLQSDPSFKFSNVMVGKSVDGTVNKNTVANVLLEALVNEGAGENAALAQLIPVLSAAKSSKMGEYYDVIRKNDLGENIFVQDQYYEAMKTLASVKPDLFNRFVAYTIYSYGFSPSIYSLEDIMPVKIDAFGDAPGIKLTKPLLVEEALNAVSKLSQEEKNLLVQKFALKFMMANPEYLKRTSAKHVNKLSTDSPSELIVRTYTDREKNKRVAFKYAKDRIMDFYPIAGRGFKKYTANVTPQGSSFAKTPVDLSKLKKISEEEISKSQETTAPSIEPSVTVSTAQPTQVQPEVSSTQPAATIQQTSTQLPGPETTINIYAGTGENADLSNFAVRPFEFNKMKYNNVESAYQKRKLAFSSSITEQPISVQEANWGILNGKEAKALGSKIVGLNKEQWDKQSSAIMKQLILESFEQNPDALAKLLATGNATLTHTQDTGKWKTEFPRLLMEVRDELRGTQPAAKTTQPSVSLPKAEEKKLFNPNDRELKKGSVVEYNGEKYIFWNENKSGKAQLIKTDGTLFPGTPGIDKLKVIGSYKTVMYNKTEYIVTDNNNIYSGATGRLVYTGTDNSSKVTKERIIKQAKEDTTTASLPNNIEKGKENALEDCNS